MRAEYINPDDLKKICRFMQNDNALALTVASKSGLRISDVLKIKPSDIDGTTVYYTAMKTGKKGSFRLPKKTIEQMFANSNDLWIFPSPMHPKNHKTRQAVYSDMTKARDIAKIKTHVTPHSTRRLFAVEVANSKGIYTAMEKLQHSNPDITKLYITTPDDVPAWAYKIADYIIDRVTKNVAELFDKYTTSV